MSASAPNSPFQRAVLGSASGSGSGSGSRLAGPSNLPTPALSASTGDTPEFQRLSTPQEEIPAFDLPGAAYEEKGHVPAPTPVLVSDKNVDRIPECWGHRGASSSFPENTKASFVEACKQGAEGIETDIFITADDELVLFHDPELDRTTDGKGKLREQPWHGVLEHVRTTEKPIQPIPMFREVLQLLLEPGNLHVKLNLDCKVDNDADKLFRLVSRVLAEFDDWQKRLAPRIILGLWHPKFLIPAATHLPFLPRYAISMSLTDSRSYFWSSVHGFSVYYSALATAAGQAFLRECQADGKNVCAWTVNSEEQMRNCARWGVQSVITDKPALWRKIKTEILADRRRALRPTLTTYILPWVTKASWTWDVKNEAKKEMDYLEGEGGRFEDHRANVGLKIVRPADLV